MLDIKFIRNNLDFVCRKMAERGTAVNLDHFIDLDAKRRALLQEGETLRSERNTVSREIGGRKKNREDLSAVMSRMAEVSSCIKELDESLKDIEEKLNGFVLSIPNIPHESVVCGTCAADNPAIRTW